MARRPGDFAMVNVAAIVTCDESGTCTAVRLVLGAVGSRPVDVSAAAEALVGEVIDEESQRGGRRRGRRRGRDRSRARTPASSTAARWPAVLVARALRGAAEDAQRRRSGVRVAV